VSLLRNIACEYHPASPDVTAARPWRARCSTLSQDSRDLHGSVPHTLAGQMSLALLIPALFGYVLGSVPSGLILTYLAGQGDIRSVGSGNIGATNVLRTGNRTLAALTLILDILKGTIAVALAPELAILGAQLLAGSGPMAAAVPFKITSDIVTQASVAAAYGAFLGHCFPVWLGFRGGKGVATFIGVLLGLFWPASVVFCAVWAGIAALFRFSSLAALVAACVAPFGTALLGRPDLAIPMLPLSLVLLYKHSANIRRLLSGEEPRIGQQT